jgi:tRNA A37 methylthiotransferase MiaB
LDAITPPGITWGIDNFHPSGIIRHFDVLLQMVAKKRLVSIEEPTQHFSFTMLKKVFPGLYISTHYIFGFPGESNQDISIANSYAKNAPNRLLHSQSLF